MYKNIPATLQMVERTRRERRALSEAAPHTPSSQAASANVVETPPVRLGPLQKIIAFGPLA